MGDRGRLIIISSPSAGGKTAVIKCFLEAHPGMVHSVSYTTRPVRPGGVDDNYYRNVGQKVFRDGIEQGMFAEWAEVHGHLYGTPKEPLENWLKDGKDVILDLDVVGALNLKKIYKERAISIFILPPSIDELKRRLADRRTDSPEVQGIRLKNAIMEMEYKNRFDHQVVNDVLENACREVGRIIGYEAA